MKAGVRIYMLRAARNGLITAFALVLLFCNWDGIGKWNTVSATHPANAVTSNETDGNSGPSHKDTSTLDQFVIPLPPTGSFYHGVFPGGNDGDENEISTLPSYKKAVGKSAAWVYFSNEWGNDRSFPQQNAATIRDSGSIPYIRLMMRSTTKIIDVNDPKSAENLFTLDNIIQGDFDSDLSAWGHEAVHFGTPLLVEYGTEVNGKWFSWNGTWNDSMGLDDDGSPISMDGADKFKTAYRHIIQTMKNEGANNIGWVFHVNQQDDPDEDWNRMESYYPGDEYIDLIGVSVYGAQSPNEQVDNKNKSFFRQFDNAYPKLTSISTDKPIALVEFGTAAGNPYLNQTKWTNEALKSIINNNGRWPRLIGFAWWNEAWPNDDDPDNDTNMRVQDNRTLAAVFKKWLLSDHVLGYINTSKN
jgi:hypothetical protein